MTVIIDGYNLIYASERWGDLMDNGKIEEARHDMLDCLARFYREKAGNIIVIFDGRTGHAPYPARPHTYEGVRTIFTGTRREADDSIIEKVKAAAQPGSITVVTSDKRIAKTASSRGASVIPSKEFRIKVFEGLKTREASRERDKPYQELHISYDEYMRMLSEHEDS